MVWCLVKDHICWWLAAIVVAQCILVPCEAKKCGVICRVRDPLTIGNSYMLKECLYEIHPVESTQNTDGSGFNMRTSDRRNRLFSLYGGSTCEYFGNMIQTAKGRDTLVETIRRQLQKSEFKGLDLQCDPVQARVTQQTYAEFLEQLRSFLGNTYVIMVTMSSCQPEPRLVESFNRMVDYVTINHAEQPSMLTNALMYGLARHRILLATPYPSTISCPLNNDYSLNEMLNQIEHHNLFGAIVELDRDDVNNVCGEGPFPLFRKVLDRLCSNAECNFSGFVRDTRDCGQYYSCDNGFKTTHHCPVGQSFDLCQSTCQPILQVQCNETTCVVSGNLPNGLTPIRYPIPFPKPNPSCPGGGGNNGGGNNGGGNNGGGNNGGGNNQTSNCCCDVLRNLTTFLNNTAQLSQFVALVKDLGVDDLVGTLRPSLQGLVDLIGNIVDPVNRLIATLLNGEKLMTDTMNGMSGMAGQGDLIQTLLSVVTSLLQNLLGGVPLAGATDGIPLLGGLGALAG
ncbi:uncharacterized protein LOC128718491 [Anopheles marshallii]|uniref:uncharacterized protein LOC128718491 n=1 Tax=Anopheles marshallii TaxID=1521116 RepID=UPI00237A1898|nr:uncharacterized protein LOC128718491 [Anopheles marshallii]